MPTSPAAAHASTPEILLGRYHTRDLEIRELIRRRLETIEKLTAARKELKRIKSKGPGEDPTPTDRHEWEAKIGRQSLVIEGLAAAKVSAELSLNQAIGNRPLPLFGSPPEDVAEDCLRTGMTLLLEHGVEVDDIQDKIKLLLGPIAYRFRVDNPPEDVDEEDEQPDLFGSGSEKHDRGERERQLAWMLRSNYRPPRPFTWLEVVAHLSDLDLDAGWRWAAAPHKHERPAAIAAVIDGNVEGFAREPGLPETLVLTDEARARLRFDMTVEISDAGHVIVRADGEDKFVGQIEAPQMQIPSFIAARMIAADPRWSGVVRSDFTWKGHEVVPPRAPKAAAPAERNPALEDIPEANIRKALKDNHGDLTAAGEDLGISRDALRRRVKNYGIDLEEYRK